MPQTPGIPALRGQKTGLPRYDAVVGREPGSLDVGHELFEEVGKTRKAEPGQADGL